MLSHVALHAKACDKCLQEGAEDDMDMDDEDGPMRIVRNYQRHDAR